MKKFLFSVVALLATMFSASAITVDEAFDQISALSGMAVVDFPQAQLSLMQADSGRIAMVMGTSKAVVDQVGSIQQQITDPGETQSQEVGGQQLNMGMYTLDLGGGKYRVLLVVEQSSQQGDNVTAMLVEGGEAMIKNMQQ